MTGRARYLAACRRALVFLRYRRWQRLVERCAVYGKLAEPEAIARVARVDRAIRRIEAILAHWTGRRRVVVSVHWVIRDDSADWRCVSREAARKGVRRWFPGARIVRVTRHRWEKV